MRRFTAYATVRNKSRHGDLDFLQLSSVIPQIKNVSGNARSLPHVIKNQKTFQFASSKDGIVHLVHAVRKAKYEEIEPIISKMPSLMQRPIAVRLVIKALLEQQDFVSAHSLLRSNIDKVGESGVVRFLDCITLDARNPTMIEDTFNLMCSYHKFHNTEISPKIVSSCLYGLLFLEDNEAYARVSKATADLFPQLSMNPSTLLATAFFHLQSANFDQGYKLIKIACSVNSFDVNTTLRFWYIVLRYFLRENADHGVVDKLISYMHHYNIPIDTSCTYMILRYLSFENRAKRPVYWLKFAKDNNFQMDASSVRTVIRNFVRFYPNEQAKKLLKSCDEMLMELGLFEPGYKPSVFGEKHSKDLKLMDRWPHNSLEILKEMERRGKYPSYGDFTKAFEALFSTKKVDIDKIKDLIDMCTKYQHNIHNSLTDLCVIKQRFKDISAAVEDKNEVSDMCYNLIHQFLTEYPLISLDLHTRTKLSLLAQNISTQYAISLVDSLRLEQTIDSGGGSSFNVTNHDSFSLRVLMLFKYDLGQSIGPFVSNLAMSNTGIYFDSHLCAAIKRMLKREGASPEVLKQIEQSNTRVFNDALDLIKTTVLYYRDVHM